MQLTCSAQQSNPLDIFGLLPDKGPPTLKDPWVFQNLASHDIDNDLRIFLNYP